MPANRERVPLPGVPDLYDILGVLPSANAYDIDTAYIGNAMHSSKQSQDIINVAYSILSNQYQRAQYDRDRLSYLHEIMKDQREAPLTNSGNEESHKVRHYAESLVNRVDDPNEKRKAQAIKNLAELRTEVEEYVEGSMDQRLVWTTSTNKVMRAAGNALCEVLVAAEDQLRELEDELGRADGLDKLEPQGAAEDMTFLPSGLKPRKLPSLPGSPTQRVTPQSASEVGDTLDSRNDIGFDSSHRSDSNSEAATEILSPSAISSLRYVDNQLRVHLKHRATNSASTVHQVATLMPGVDRIQEVRPVGMGLVEFQRIHGLVDPTNKENNAVFALHQLADISLERRRCTMPANPGVTVPMRLRVTGANKTTDDPFRD